MSDSQFHDPGDSTVYLRQHDWTKLVELDESDDDDAVEQSHSEYYSRTFEENGHTLEVLLEISPSGRRKFYVADPPDDFREAAHDGRCLTTRGIADGDEIYRLHFNTKPDSIADGGRTIKRLLRGERADG